MWVSTGLCELEISIAWLGEKVIDGDSSVLLQHVIHAPMHAWQLAGLAKLGFHSALWLYLAIAQFSIVE